MLNKIVKLLKDPKFRENIFLILFPIKNFRIVFGQNFMFLDKNALENKNKIIIKVFLQQLVFGIPAIFYELYFKYFEYNKLEKISKVTLKKNEIKKIGIYSPWFDKFAGGGEKVTAYFALFFEEKYPDAQVVIILNDLFGKRSQTPANLDDINKKYGVKLNKTVLIDYHHGFMKMFKIKFLSNFLKTTNEYDIFINCFMNLYPGLAKINYHYVHFPMEPPTAISNFIFKKYQKAYKAFITNSEYTDYWTRQILEVKNTKIIYPCIDIPKLNKPLKKKNIILTVSRLSIEKKIEALIEVFQDNLDKLQDYEFHIAGASNPKNLEYYEYLISLSKDSRIKFFPNISIDDLIQKYKDSKIYWNAMGFGFTREDKPQHFEHFGLTVAEAMSYGVVPIVIDKGGPAEIVNKGDCGLTWFTKEELLTQTIKLINDNELYEQYQKNAIEYSKNFSEQSFFKHFEELLENDLIGK